MAAQPTGGRFDQTFDCAGNTAFAYGIITASPVAAPAATPLPATRRHGLTRFAFSRDVFALTCHLRSVASELARE